MIKINDLLIKLLLILSLILINNFIYKFKNLNNLYSKLKSSIMINKSIINNNLLYKLNKNIINYNNKKIIYITFSLDNKLIYQTLVVITSVLENNDNKKHYIIFYLFISQDFKEKNIKIFESLKLKYQFEINYYYTPNIFINLRRWRHSYAFYYKLLIPILIPNIKRIIHLDGDTLVFKDLGELFNLPFNDNYYLGQPTSFFIYKNKKRNRSHINVGVLLINIEKIRKDNKDISMLKYLFKKKLLEQFVINKACSPKIGYLPFKYGIFANIHNKNNKYQNYLEMILDKKLNITEVIEAIKDPSIVHVVNCNPKYWYKRKQSLDIPGHEYCNKYQKIFYYYAKKTIYYKLIYNKFMK